MAYVRFKGPYVYLVRTERVRDGNGTKVAQRVLCYLGRAAAVNEDVVRRAAARFPDVTLDWDVVRQTLAAGATRPGDAPEAAVPAGPERRPRVGETWEDWD